MTEEVESRKEKIKKWFKDPYNLAVFAIILFAVIVRLYFFFATTSQPLWWDEAEYMSRAKKWAFNIPYEFGWPRMPLLPFIASIIFKLGFSEIAVKFFVEILASIGVVVFAYLSAKEMYDKKTALIVCFMFSVFWLALFNSVRLHTDVPLMFFMYAAIFFFWKGYIKGRSIKHMVLFGIFCALALLMKPTAGILFIAVFIFLLIAQKISFLSKKEIWISVLAFFILMIPYLVYALQSYGNPLEFLKGSHVFSEPSKIAEKPLGWNVLSYPLWFSEWPFFIFFIFGLIMAFGMLIIKFDIILKNKEDSSHNDLFMIIWLLATFIYFIFIERQAPEDRWVMPIALAIFIFASKGIIILYDIIKKYQKTLAVLFVILVMMAGFYFQIYHANSIIQSKKDTYSQVRDAALWMKENTGSADSIVTASVTQTAFYSERKIISFYNDTGQKYYTPEEFTSVLLANKPKYLVISIFEPAVPQWTYTYPENNTMLAPVKAFTMDNENVLIIYSINYAS